MRGGPTTAAARVSVSEAAGAGEGTSAAMSVDAPQQQPQQQRQQQQRSLARLPLALLALGAVALLPHTTQGYQAPAAAARPPQRSSSGHTKPRLALRPLSTAHPVMAAAATARVPPCFAHHHQHEHGHAHHDGCGCSSCSSSSSAQQQEQEQGRGPRFLRRLPGRVLGKAWRGRRRGAAEEGVEEEGEGEGEGLVPRLSKLAVLAAIGPNPWDR